MSDRTRAGLAVACVLIVVLTAHHFTNSMRSQAFFLDFRAFYCAGHVVAQGADPYLVQPLLSCEKNVNADISTSNIAIPAPLPGYSLAAFAVLSFLPYVFAQFLVLAVMLGCYALAVYATSRLTGYTQIGIAAALAPVMYYLINLGQLTSILSLSLVTLAALQLRDRHYVPAAIACCMAAIEPHTALPSYLAMLIWLPQCRKALLIGAGALACISFFAIGLHGNVEYLIQVLPLHARVGAADPFQYSLTWLLHYFGVPGSLALFIGSLWYIALTGLGLFMTYRIVLRYPGEEAFVLLPPVAAMLGGSHVHIQQIAATVPGVLYLARRAMAFMPFVLTALLIVAIPWLTIATTVLYQGYKYAAVLTLTAALAFVAAFSLCEIDAPKRRALIALANVVLIVVLALGIRAVPGNQHTAPSSMKPATIAPTDYASASWEIYIQQIAGFNGTNVLLMKIPTWACLTMLLGTGFILGSKRGRQREVLSRAATADA